MQREHLVVAVLADDTRFSIYRHVAERPCESLAVKDVAARFGLHPNVARMHLGKLEQAGLLATALRRDGAGGRPARLYRLADDVSTFAFPPRRYELLAGLALDVLAEAGDREQVRRVCRRAGGKAAAAYRQERRIEGALTGHSLAAAVQDVAEEQGLLPEVEWDDEGLHIEIRNCVFREAAADHPELSCVIHRAFVEGLLEGLDGHGRAGAVCADGPSLGQGGSCCRLTYTLSAARRETDSRRTPVV